MKQCENIIPVIIVNIIIITGLIFFVTVVPIPCSKRLTGSPARSPPRHSNEENQDGVSVRGIPGLCLALPIRLACDRKRKQGRFALLRMVLRCMVLPCMVFVLHGIALNCMVLHCVAWYCMVLHGGVGQSDDVSTKMRNRQFRIQGAFHCMVHIYIYRDFTTVTLRE